MFPHFGVPAFDLEIEATQFRISVPDIEEPYERLPAPDRDVFAGIIVHHFGVKNFNIRANAI